MVDYDIEKIMKELEEYHRAEEEAFKKAGIETGLVEFECPLCKGLAIGSRYYHHGRLSGLGSYCTKCKVSHT